MEGFKQTSACLTLSRVLCTRSKSSQKGLDACTARSELEFGKEPDLEKWLMARIRKIDLTFKSLSVSNLS